jgi:hypothetical protein
VSVTFDYSDPHGNNTLTITQANGAIQFEWHGDAKRCRESMPADTQGFVAMLESQALASADAKALCAELEKYKQAEKVLADHGIVLWEAQHDKSQFEGFSFTDFQPLVAQEKRVKELETALAPLVAAYREKLEHGETPFYRALKEGVWQKAFAVLHQFWPAVVKRDPSDVVQKRASDLEAARRWERACRSICTFVFGPRVQWDLKDLVEAVRVLAGADENGDPEYDGARKRREAAEKGVYRVASPWAQIESLETRLGNVGRV